MSLAELERAVDEAWPRAQARWSSFLSLRKPRLCVDEPGPPSVAWIDLATRQIGLDAKAIDDKRLASSVEALLSHEIGHHVRYPGSLGVQARLRLLERTLLPIEGYSVVNLFTDLMINERLGHDLQEELCQVYRAFTSRAVDTEPEEGKRGWGADPAFAFYLAIYEELWRRLPGELMGRAREGFEEAHPGYRADAHVLSQDLFRMGPNLYTQFLYFVSIVSRYVKPLVGEKPEGRDPIACRGGEPTPEDWADALMPSAAEREAVARALREGWISKELGDRLTSEPLERRIGALPGQGTDDAERVPEIMAAYYRREAERYLLKPPPVRQLGEAVVPTTLEDWELGDAPHAIDWLATLVTRGAELGKVAPLVRERIADYEGHEVPLWQPRTEIYLDVSGSMPDPRMTLNAMTLAAQILTVGTLRAGGWARALLYSSDFVRYWTYCRSEVEISRFLMHYIGGGTSFPFGVLAESLDEEAGRQPIRVVISDRDFDHNYSERPEHAHTFARAADLSSRLVLLLHAPDPEAVSRYRAAGASVVEVMEMDDFPRMAAALSAALFDGPRGAGGMA